MQTNRLLREGLVVGIILLFVGIACSPVINARNNTIVSKPLSIPEKEDTVSITVLEYKADGTIGKSVVKMPQEQIERFREELNGVKDLDLWLSVYKKYNLIPQNVTAEKLRLGMEEKARRLGPEINTLQKYVTKLKSNSFLSDHFSINFFCVVNSYWVGGFRFLFGTSLLLSIINFYSPFLIPSLDLFQINIGLAGRFATYNGILPNSSFYGIPIASFIAGFVGYYVTNFPTQIFFTTSCTYIGYAVACLGFSGYPISYKEV